MRQTLKERFGVSSETRRISRGFLLAVSLACVWVLFLVTLAVTTANPVVVNRDQIARSDYLLTATVSSADASQVAVEKVWKREANWTSLVIEGLQQCRLQPNAKYVIPISRTQHKTYQVTPVAFVEPPGWVYPATESTLEQMQQILSELAKRSR